MAGGEKPRDRYGARRPTRVRPTVMSEERTDMSEECTFEEGELPSQFDGHCSSDAPNPSPEPVSDYNNVYYESLSEKIIVEVQKRPPLYDTTLRQYSNRAVKAKLWKEVCAAIDTNWDEMTEFERRAKSDLIQKRWKNMRDSLSKELTMQRKKCYKGVVKKKKYIHYDSLLFLVPFIKKRDPPCPGPAGLRQQENNSDVDNPPSPPQVVFQEEGDTDNQGIPTNMLSQSDADEDDIEQITVKNIIPKPINNTDYDEDINFSKMIVPLLRKLNDGQKHYAKIEIMNILEKAKYYSPFVQLPIPEAYQVYSHSSSKNSKKEILVPAPIKQERSDPLSENGDM